MRAAYTRCLLAMSGDDAYTLIDLLCDVLWSTGFQERNATGTARLEDPLSGLLHVWWVRLTGHLLVAQGQPQVTRTHFGKAKARHTQNLLDVGHPCQALDFHSQEQFALRIEWPRISTVNVLFLTDTPHLGRRSLGAAPACPTPETAPDANGAERIAARLHKGPHGVGRLRLAQQHAVHAAGEDLPALPGVIAHHHLVRAVHREFHNDCWGAMAAAGGSPVCQTPHILV